MNEFTYHGPPIERVVPVIHVWLPGALAAWTRVMYGRRRAWFAWGWLLLVVVLFIALKVYLYLAVVALLSALFVLTALFDLVSYPLRRYLSTPALGD